MKKKLTILKGVSYVALAMAMASCATFRGMPTHGGGKRFDEEQRLISKSIQHASSKMDLCKLSKRKVALEVVSLPTSGSARMLDYGFVDDVFGYRFNPRLEAFKNITREDVEYLEGAVTQELRKCGYQVTSPADANIYLVVLVDCLGTNHRRLDYGLAYQDFLGASCELTYYAVDAQTQEMIESAATVGSFADYWEVNLRFTPFRFHDYEMHDLKNRMIDVPKPRQHRFDSGYDLAHVDHLQKKLKPAKKVRKKGRAPEVPLPVEGDQAAGLPLLPDLGEKPIRQIDQIKAHAEAGKQAIKDKKVNLAEKHLAEIRKLRPDSKIADALEKRIDGFKQRHAAKKLLDEDE